MRCVICASAIEAPAFSSTTGISVNSLAQITSGSTIVWACTVCGHTQSNELSDTEQFYDSGYNISLGTVDEDQVYEVKEGRIIYRHDVQLEVLENFLEITYGAQMLDYGCAKATMMRRVRLKYPQVGISLFDVSSNYQNYWDEITTRAEQSVYKTPENWLGRFDIVTSFFAFEHIPDPISAAKHVFSLLKRGGYFYCVVPYFIDNIGDFVVVDHVNHFTISSVRAFLTLAGFGDIVVDTTSHRGALVFKARAGGSTDENFAPDKNEISRTKNIAAYWNEFVEYIHDTEDRLGNSPVAIYGAGFYGALILSSLKRPECVKFFADKSPFLQGKAINGINIIDPESGPVDVAAIYVGLNPAIPPDQRIQIAKSLGTEAEVILLPDPNL